jgi:hypothetical protein
MRGRRAQELLSTQYCNDTHPNMGKFSHLELTTDEAAANALPVPHDCEDAPEFREA